MNYSRILAAALLCSTIGIAHASQTSAQQTKPQLPQVSPQDTFNTIAENIETAYQTISDTSKALDANAFKKAIGIIHPTKMAAAWKVLDGALQDTAQATAITADYDLSKLKEQIAAITKKAEELKIDSKNATLIRFNTVAKRLNDVCDTVKPAVKATPTPETDKGFNKPEEPKNNDADKDKNKDPKNDPVNNAGFFRTYLFNAKTGTVACLLAGAYWYYTNYMQSQEPTSQESAAAEIEVTEQAVQ